MDTEAGQDIVLDLRWKGGQPAPTAISNAKSVRVMALICYHAQMVIKENSVEMSY